MTQPARKIDIKDLLKEKLAEGFAPLGTERFRATQVLDWVYRRCADNFSGMNNLPAGLRRTLDEKFYISNLEVARKLESKDGVKKFLFQLEDGEKIESVFIPSKSTSTVCLSSQVGCKFACKFCASGKTGFVRNLRPAEIINQALFFRKNKYHVTNIVLMGMGEPLDNYDNVLKAVRILNAPYGLGVGQRKITISTCGLIPEIKKLAKEKLQVELSVSIHSPNDKTRSILMGVNNKYPLKDLMEACRGYAKQTNRQITFEYVLIKGLNDSKKDAQDLAGLVKGMLAKVNLIAFNPVEGLDYVPPGLDCTRMFKGALDRKGIVSTVRNPRGADIEAACGQLRLRH